MISEKSQLVLRVNELFHDIEQSDYDDKHDDIFVGEKERWNRIGKMLFEGKNSSFTILDIGTGTGFVPLQLGKFMRMEDNFICSDISEKILGVCREKVNQEKFNGNFRYLKTDGIKLELPSESVEVVTLNSVLHHIPDVDIALAEMSRVLKKGGRLIIGHEANRLFFSNKALSFNFKLFDCACNPRKALLNLARYAGLLEPLRKIYLKSSGKKGKYEKLAGEINDSLLAEGMIEKPLKTDEIFDLIDIHSPAKGAAKKNKKGFDVRELTEKYLNDFEISHFETYNHFSKLSSRNSIFKRIDSFLKKVYPNEGSAFLAIFTKN